MNPTSIVRPRSNYSLRQGVSVYLTFYKEGDEIFEFEQDITGGVVVVEVFQNSSGGFPPRHEWHEFVTVHEFPFFAKHGWTPGQISHLKSMIVRLVPEFNFKTK
jgi:hypothetical protein